jgi:hypothetical protein
MYNCLYLYETDLVKPRNPMNILRTMSPLNHPLFQTLFFCLSRDYSIQNNTIYSNSVYKIYYIWLLHQFWNCSYRTHFCSYFFFTTCLHAGLLTIYSYNVQATKSYRIQVPIKKHVRYQMILFAGHASASKSNRF